MVLFLNQTKQTFLGVQKAVVWLGSPHTHINSLQTKRHLLWRSCKQFVLATTSECHLVTSFTSRIVQIIPRRHYSIWTIAINLQLRQSAGTGWHMGSSWQWASCSFVAWCLLRSLQERISKRISAKISIMTWTAGLQFPHLDCYSRTGFEF